MTEWGLPSLKFLFSVSKLSQIQISLLMWPRNALGLCDKFVDYDKDQKKSKNVWDWWKQVSRGTCQTFFNHHYLMVENLQHHDSLSPLPGQKAKTQIRCDRQIAARCGCFGKQDRLCLSDEKCSGGRQTGLWDSEGRDRERARRGRRRTVQNENETAKCWTV